MIKYTLILIAISLIFLAGCIHQNDFTADTPGFQLDPSATGFANWFVSEDSARHMRHYFEIWHRNRQYFDLDGRPLRVGTSYDSLGDVDLGLDQKTSPHNDTLSKSVWFDKKVIIEMARILNTPKFNCDGLRVYFAAYNQMDTVHIPSQINAHQSTVFFVPTCGHKDNYDIFQALWDKVIGSNTLSNSTIVSGGAYNHGELCPKVCN